MISFRDVLSQLWLFSTKIYSIETYVAIWVNVPNYLKCEN